MGLPQSEREACNMGLPQSEREVSCGFAAKGEKQVVGFPH